MLEDLEQITITKKKIESNYNLNTSLALSASSVSAGLPDICLDEFSITSPDGKSIYPTHKKSNLKFNVSNIGNATSTLCYLNLYVNDIRVTSEGYGSRLPDLEAGYYFEFEMPFSWSAGKNTIKFTANDQRLMGETDYSNNEVKKTTTWKDYPDPGVMDFYIEDGSTRFHAMETKDFIMKIGNYGRSDIDNLNIKIRDQHLDIIFDEGLDIGGGDIWELIISITPLKKQTVRYQAILDKDREISDYDRTNNSLYSENYQIDFALILNGCKQQDSGNLTIGICPSMVEYASELGITTDEIINAICKWNKENSKINFKPVLVDTERPDTKIRMVAESGDPSWLGLCSYIKLGGYFANGVKITINTSIPDWDRYTKAQKLAVITHECGHSIGLGDSRSADKAIMHYGKGGSYDSDYITDQDRYCLNYLY